MDPDTTFDLMGPDPKIFTPFFEKTKNNSNFSNEFHVWGRFLN